MLGKLLERKELVMTLFVLGLLILSSSAAQGRDQMSLHVLFTGNVGGRMEPSG